MFHKQNGNALLYVLIAVTLLAVLTYTIMGENRGQQQNQLSESKVKLMASDLISHANVVQMAVHQMKQWGINEQDLLAHKPDNANYTSLKNNQIYHPEGGGVTIFNPSEQYFEQTSVWSTDPSYTGWRGWQTQKGSNVEWSQTTADDYIFSFIGIAEEICKEINYQLHGEKTIYTNQETFYDLLTWNGTDPDLDVVACPDCENKFSACISYQATNQYAFYNVISNN